MAETLRLVSRTPTETLLNFLYRQRIWLNETDIQDTVSETVHALMDVEVNRMLDAGRYERNNARRAYRNGYRESLWQTSLGCIELHIPKLRKGSYYPIFLDEDVLIDFALDAYVLGVSLAMVEKLATNLGLESLSRRELFDLCERLNDAITSLWENLLHTPTDRLRIHVLQSEVEQHGRKQRVLIAVVLGDGPDGKTRFVAHEVTREADETFWADFIRRLERKGVERDEVESLSRNRLSIDQSHQPIVISQAPRPIMLREVMVDTEVRAHTHDIPHKTQKPMGILLLDFRTPIQVAA